MARSFQPLILRRLGILNDRRDAVQKLVVSHPRSPSHRRCAACGQDDDRRIAAHGATQARGEGGRIGVNSQVWAMLSTFLPETRWMKARKSATEPLPPRRWVVQVRSPGHIGQAGRLQVHDDQAAVAPLGWSALQFG